jgi:nucleotide-binding universal stress UspA family protein
MFRNILIPIDISEPDVSAEAVTTAVALAKAFDSNLRLIHVASPIIPGSPMAVIPQSVYDEIGVYEKSQLEAMAAAIDRPRDRVSTAVRIGGVYPELLAEAQQWPADMIVVGAHRRSMATYLLGSTAAAVSRHATCTVMIVRSAIKAKLM